MCLGFVAHLPEMFRDAPRTASKFVRAIGHSSVGAIAHNPAKHPVEQWSLKAADVATEVAAWRQGYLATDEFDDLTTDEIEHLVSRLTFTRFKKGDALLDNFARSEVVIFVVAGSVDVVSEGRRLHTRAAGDPKFQALS